MSDEAREEVLGLIGELSSELESLPKDADAGRIRSALSLTEASALESERVDRDPDSPLREQTFGALGTAVQELEASHPRVAQAIGRISDVLSRMGI
ncbi:MAG: DUF4404 family protein [Verrucomicrobiales bacterium]